MSWLKRDDRKPDSKSVAIFLDGDDAEYAGVIEELAQLDFQSLTIKGGTFSDLLFLLPHAHQLKSLTVQGTVTTSFDGIEGLVELVDLDCAAISKTAMPLLTPLAKLEKCSLSWDRKYDKKNCGLFELPNLVRLTVRYWTGAECREIGRLTQLEQLDLRESRALATLQGLEGCSRLKALELYALTNLNNIDAVAALKSIEKLHVINCKKIINLMPFTELKNMRAILLDKLNAQLPNVRWVSAMPHLELLRMSCDVAEIDWKMLFNHPHLATVGFASHDGYSVSDEDILKIAGTARREVRSFGRIGTRKRPAFSFSLA